MSYSPQTGWNELRDYLPCRLCLWCPVLFEPSSNQLKTKQLTVFWSKMSSPATSAGDGKPVNQWGTDHRKNRVHAASQTSWTLSWAYRWEWPTSEHHIEVSIPRLQQVLNKSCITWLMIFIGMLFVWTSYLWSVEHANSSFKPPPQFHINKGK